MPPNTSRRLVVLMQASGGETCAHPFPPEAQTEAEVWPADLTDASALEPCLSPGSSGSTECAFDLECSSGYACIEHTCRPVRTPDAMRTSRHCVADQECGAGFRCDDGLCRRVDVAESGEWKDAACWLLAENRILEPYVLLPHRGHTDHP